MTIMYKNYYENASTSNLPSMPTSTKAPSQADIEADKLLNAAPSQADLEADKLLGVSQEAPVDVKKEISDIGMLDKAAVMNFIDKPEAKIAYLQKKYPDHEFRIGMDNEVEGKKKNETSWGRLDPEGLDFGNIVGNAYNVASGLVTGAAGIGATPLAGAAVGVGTEALRQGIGKYLEPTSEVNPAEIATVGAVSGALPLVGKGIKAGAKELLKKMPSVSQALTGIDKNAWKAVVERPNEVKQVGKDGSVKYLNRAIEDAGKKVKNFATKSSENFENALQQHGDIKIDVRPAKNVVNEFVNKINSSKALSETDKSKIRGIKALTEKFTIDTEYNSASDAAKKEFILPKLRQVANEGGKTASIAKAQIKAVKEGYIPEPKYLKSTIGELPERIPENLRGKIPISTARKVIDDINSVESALTKKLKMEAGLSPAMTEETKATINAASKVAATLKSSIKNTPMGEAYEEYAKAASIKNSFKKLGTNINNIGQPAKKNILTALNRAGKNIKSPAAEYDKQLLQTIDDTIGSDLVRSAENFSAYKAFENVGVKGNAHTEHLIRRGIGATIGGSFGHVPGATAGLVLTSPTAHKLAIKGLRGVSNFPENQLPWQVLARLATNETME